MKEEIKEYLPFNEQEEVDKEHFLKLMDNFQDVLTRDNTFGHLTASAFIVNPSKTKLLVVYHIINDGWMYPGGHADGEEDLLRVAIREVEEETGLTPKVLDNKIYGIQTCPVSGHVKRGKYVSAHTHYDVIYLMEADDTLPLSYKDDESKAIKWISFEETQSKEMLKFMQSIYQKLIDKLNKLV